MNKTGFYPFIYGFPMEMFGKEKHFDEFREKSPSAKIMLVDGEMFS